MLLHLMYFFPKGYKNSILLTIERKLKWCARFFPFFGLNMQANNGLTDRRGLAGFIDG